MYIIVQVKPEFPQFIFILYLIIFVYYRFMVE